LGFPDFPVACIPRRSVQFANDLWGVLWEGNLGGH
jgi:hypothetical protein